MEEQTGDFNFSSIDNRVDKLIKDFGNKFQKMSRDMWFNQYGSFLCDPLDPPNPQNPVVSSVIDDMIAAITYIPQPSRLLLMHASTSPMVALVPEDMPSAGFSKENPTSQHCSQFALPWSILSPKLVAQDSKETQAKDTQTRHPLKPVSQNVSRTKIGEAADGSKGIQDNDIPSVGSLKENVSVRQVSPIIQPRNMAKVVHVSKGTQAKARQSVGLSKDNPIARQRSPTMQPQARHPLKPLSHNVSRAKTDEVVDDSKGVKGNRVLSVGSSKENVSARQCSPTILLKIKGPPMTSSYNRAPQNKLEKVSSKENPSAHNRSATAVTQKRHPPKPSTHSISGVPDNKMAKIAHKPKANQAKDTLSVSFSKENPSARLVSSTARPQARHSPKLVPHDPKGIPDKDIPSKGSLKENVSAHQLSPTIRPRTNVAKCSKEEQSARLHSSTARPQARHPPKPVSHNVSRATNKRVSHDPNCIQEKDISSAGSSKEKIICQTNADHSKIKSKTLKPQLKSCVTLVKEVCDNAKLENENPKGQFSGVSEVAEVQASHPVATDNVNDEWVGCDICNKWRLLPYGTNTADLPNKWGCKMQTWLPGLNKCSISEQESHKAFRDLYPGPDFKNGSNLSGHRDIVASDIGKFQKTDCATKKQKVRSWEESQAGQFVDNKKLKFTDEACESRDISASDIGRSEKADCGNKKRKVRSWEEILKAEKHAGRRWALNKVEVSQKSSDDHVDRASDLYGIRKNKASYLENRYVDTHKAIQQKKLEKFNSCSSQHVHLPSKYCSTLRHEVDLKESENNQNTTQHYGSRHPTPDVEVVQCPIKKCNNSKTIHALKVATDLRDTAKRLEDERLGTESTRLYFQSALKFLHAASLAEPSDHHDIKYEEATESIRLYVEASKICQYCATEFEKCGKVAVAALAYKCLEVANFKVAFIQYPFTRKDQNELRATFKLDNPGDSPSSVDLGADCIKTPVWLDPSTLAKDASSPQIAGHHVITAQCRPTYTRWLENTTKTICAFEASVKAHNAFGAAIDRMGKEAKSLYSVKDALNINFHNIEELLRLVDLSVESINWKYR